VLVSVDTLRADHLGSYGYFRDTTPHIDAFGDRAIRFERVRATMATTLPSHLSMLTGRYPLEHGTLANVAHGGAGFSGAEHGDGGLVSAVQVLQDAGYRTAGFIGARTLERATGFAAGFDVFDEPADVERQAGEVIDHALAWLGEQEPDPRHPFFLFVHLFDPHWKHEPPEPFLSMFSDDADLEAWVTEREIGDFAMRNRMRKATNTLRSLNRYCGEIRYTDEQLGRLFDALDEQGRFADSIVCFVADHGDGLNQHAWVAHGMVWEEQLRVPWLLHLPGDASEPRVVAADVSLLDLFPTLFARLPALDTPLAARFAAQATGVDVLAPDAAARGPRRFFAQRTGREIPDDPGPIFALVEGDWKLLVREQQGDALFDLARDPHELENLIEAEPERARAMRADLEASLAEQRRRGAAVGADRPGPAADPERLRMLESLGYVGADSAIEGEDE